MTDTPATRLTQELVEKCLRNAVDAYYRDDRQIEAGHVRSHIAALEREVRVLTDALAQAREDRNTHAKVAWERGAQLAAVTLDAERYRHLKAHAADLDEFVRVDTGFSCWLRTDIDELLDASRAALAAGEKP